MHINTQFYQVKGGKFQIYRSNVNKIQVKMQCTNFNQDCPVVISCDIQLHEINYVKHYSFYSSSVKLILITYSFFLLPLQLLKIDPALLALREKRWVVTMSTSWDRSEEELI